MYEAELVPNISFRLIIIDKSSFICIRLTQQYESICVYVLINSIIFFNHLFVVKHNTIMRIYISLFFLLISNLISAQNYTISGYVRDAENGEELIGATVYVKQIKNGTISNSYGYYSLTLKKGDYDIVFSFLGYENIVKHLSLNKSVKQNISLKLTSKLANEVTIQADKIDRNLSSIELGTVKMPVKSIKALPAIFGEVDILKSIQLLPGVQSAGEGSAGFYVRGGGPDQNLILLDGANVYNSSHLFGFFSVFNADAIKDVKLVKGGMPANYGGRLSSVLDISMKEGNMKKFKAQGGIGLISSRLTLEGPIKVDTSSFIISGRRTYIDFISQPFLSDTSMFAGSGYYFYDLNAKVNYRLSDKDRLFLSSYFGRDVFSFNNNEDDMHMNIPWGNATTSLRWNHLFSDKLFVNSTLLYSDYKFDIDIIQSGFELKLFSGITDYSYTVDFNYFPNINHKISFGGQFIRHSFVPSSVSLSTEEEDTNIGEMLKQYANDVAIYINDEFDVTEKLKLNIGLRPTYFQQVGPFNRYIKDDEGSITDTIVYAKGENVVRFVHLEPRISARYRLNSKSSLKAGFTQNYQYIHMASISSVSMPTDLWVPSSDVVKPQFGTQYSFGYFRNFKDNTYEASAELYYKTLENQIEYMPGSTPGDNVGDNADNNFTFGSGQSYGLELFFKKNFGTTTGWIGYTLSKTTRIFEDINNGKEFPVKYDRRHDVSLIINHSFNDKWTASIVFVYATGNTYTPILGRYFMENGTIVTEYGDYNSYRMKAYHRMDFSLTYTLKKTKMLESSFNFSVYNLYNRHNPYFIYFDFEGDITEGVFSTFAKQVTIFPILPSIAWNFKF